MAKQIIGQNRFYGISYSDKEGIKSSYKWAQSVDYRTDPTKATILPRTKKVSGNVVTDFILDYDRYLTDTYFIGDTGHIYLRDKDEAWSDLHTVPDCVGNGMKYYGEEQYLHYTSNTTLGRYGPLTGDANFADDFLGAEGGVPTNTYSLDLESGSSQYATAADSATLSIISDLTLESYVKFESLPAVGEEMTIVSKWNGSGNLRSYRFGLYGVSGYFGDGGDGAKTIVADTTQAPTDSACTGTVAAYSLTATNVAFAADDKILIHQTRGTNAGRYERNEIASYTAGTITLQNALKNTYTTGAQVIVLPEYTNVTVNAGKTWTAKAWNGTVGGILAFLASGTVTVAGSINATGKGFRGGVGGTVNAYQGEGTGGAGGVSQLANGNGGGGGRLYNPGDGTRVTGGGGGGNGDTGVAGGILGPVNGGAGGSAKGTSDLTTMTFGGGGGGGSRSSAPLAGGGTGGGIISITGATTTITGTVIATGNAGGAATAVGSGGGGGAGGSILIKAQVATLGTSLVTAAAGVGGANSGSNTTAGGAGSVGRVHLDYYTSYTGTTSPTLNATQDDTLITNTTYQLRFQLSNNGTATESLVAALDSAAVDKWYRLAVSWDASEKTATFYVDANSLGTSTGAMTAIYDSTALFAIGANFNAAGAAENFLDGKVDDTRVWNDIRTANELKIYKDIQLAGVEANLQAYYKVNNALTDDSPNSNTLTLVAAPVYSMSDVPFSSPTTRRDLDQSLNTTGQAYTLATTISEGATHRQTFVPTKDPQKSIEVLIATVGTGNWTCTVHDALNRVINSKTVALADLNVGDFEFVFSTSWRPVIGASYHFHLTSTVADGTVTTTTTVDLETADFHTYYSFLVEDIYHPIEQILNKLAIGNERYLATWDAITYNPHRLTFPSGYRIRCLATWREYLAIGAVIGDNIEDYDQGRIFFWDGNSTTYNFYIDVPQGGINAMLNGDPLYFMAGYSGDFMKYAGGNPVKVKRMPNIATSSILEINRKAITMYRALVHIGLAEDSTDTTIERGVYSYGTLMPELPETLSFDYPISQGVTTGADLEIGMLVPIGSSLFISWRNGSSYGVDSVSPDNNPFATAKIEFLITDFNKIWAEKQAQTIASYFKKLVSGDSMTLKYKIDRNDTWTYGDEEDTADAKEIRLSMPTKANRFSEFQIGINMATTNSDSPEFYGFGFELDDLNRERRV